MVSKTYSLRPPAAGDKDVGLETLFRVEMKRDDLAAEGLKPGDAVSVVSQAGRGGVGVAWLSIDTAKSQGNSPFIKMHPRLRDFMGLELSDKCSIARYDGPQQIIKTVEIQQSGKHGSEMSAGDLQHWAGIALGRTTNINWHNNRLTACRTASMHRKHCHLQCEYCCWTSWLEESSLVSWDDRLGGDSSKRPASCAFQIQARHKQGDLARLERTDYKWAF